MKKFKYIFFVISLGLIFFNSCKDEDSFNWSTYEPLTPAVTGPSEIISVPTLTYTYTTTTVRGGSTYTWEVIEGSDIISIAARTGSYYNSAIVTIEESTPVTIYAEV